MTQPFLNFAAAAAALTKQWPVVGLLGNVLLSVKTQNVMILALALSCNCSSSSSSVTVSRVVV